MSDRFHWAIELERWKRTKRRSAFVRRAQMTKLEEEKSTSSLLIDSMSTYDRENNLWYYLHRTNQEKRHWRASCWCHSRVRSNKTHSMAADWWRNPPHLNLFLRRTRKTLQISRDWFEDWPRRVACCWWNCSCSSLKTERNDQMTEWRKPTEEPNIFIGVHLVEQSPISGVQRSIGRSLINVPGDVSLCRAIAKAKRKERHLRGWIDPLKIHIRHAQRGDDATTHIEVKVCSPRSVSLYPMVIVGEKASSTWTRTEPVMVKLRFCLFCISTIHW